MAERAYIALGSNLGGPLSQLQFAYSQIGMLGTVTGASSIYRTAAVGGPKGQPDYLNAVVELGPSAHYADPPSLLAALQDIERDSGRVRRVRWEARTLDLDLLTLGEQSVFGPDLVVPHPRLLERPFVLAPLCEVAPQWRHPHSGEGACEALARLPEARVERTKLRWTAG